MRVVVVRRVKAVEREEQVVYAWLRPLFRLHSSSLIVWQTAHWEKGPFRHFLSGQNLLSGCQMNLDSGWNLVNAYRHFHS